MFSIPYGQKVERLIEITLILFEGRIAFAEYVEGTKDTVL